MNLNDTYRDLADRAETSLNTLPDLNAGQLNAHPGGHPNSIAWLLWHSGRVLDVNVAALSGNKQLWEADGFRDRFQLGEVGDAVGVGQSAEEAGEVEVDDRQLLVDYLTAVLGAYRGYVATVGESEWDEVIGEFKGAPDTRQARLTLIIVDALRHIDQALYVAGIPELGR